MGKPKDRSPKVKPSRFIAMLRGINVSGHKIIKMESLRRCFEGMGFRDVVTYVQSGNVIFEADGKFVANLSDQIGKRILRDFGFSVPVLLKTSTEIERIVHDNPFVNQAGIDHSKLHVTFLSAVAPKSAAMNLKALAMAPEQFHIRGREIYLYCPNGYGITKLSNNAIEKRLGVEATTRNWKSVNALLALTH